MSADDGAGPGEGRDGRQKPGANGSPTTLPPPTDIARQLRRRRAAADRLPPLACGHRDPLLRLVRPDGPATFGLVPAELRREALRLWSAGWSPSEVCLRLAIRPRPHTCPCCDGQVAA